MANFKKMGKYIHRDLILYLRHYYQGQTAAQNVFGVERGGFGVGRLYQITQAFN